MTKLELRGLLREEIRKALNESAKRYSLNEQTETVTVLYIQGAQNWDTNSGKYVSLDQSAVKNAIAQGSYVQIPNTTLKDVLDDINVNNSEYPKDANYPGQDNPKIKNLFRQNMKAMIKGDESAGDMGYEGWLPKNQKPFSVNGVQALAVPVGYDFGGKNPKPILTALVGGANLIR